MFCALLSHTATAMSLACTQSYHAGGVYDLEPSGMRHEQCYVFARLLAEVAVPSSDERRYFSEYEKQTDKSRLLPPL